MRKTKSKKFISLLITFTLLATMLFAYAGPALAATTNMALTVPNVTLGNNRTLGTLRIIETADTIGSIQEGPPGVGTEIMVTLPAGTTYVAAPTAGTLGNYVNVPGAVGTVNNRLTAADIQFVSATNQTLTIRVDNGNAVPNDPGGAAAGSAIIEFLFNVAAASQVNIAAGAGELKVLVNGTAGVTEGEVTVANIVTGATTVAALSAPTRTEGANRGIGTIRFTENTVGALQVGANSIDLVLPDGFTWNATPAPTLSGGFPAGAVTVGVVDVDASGRSRARLNVNFQSAGTRGVFDLAGWTIDIAPTAPLGDIQVTVSGANPGLTPTVITVARNAVFGVTVSAENPRDIFAGRFDAPVGEVVIAESLAGSLIAGRTITLELPQGVAWRAIPVPNVTRGNAVVGAGVIVPNTNNRMVSYNVTAASTAASTIRFITGTVDINVDTPAGNIDVQVAGTATASGTATVGKIIAPLTASATTPEVKIGQQNQAAGDIAIKEAGAGVILARPRGFAGNLLVVCPAGVSFSALPAVSVTEGNLILNTANITLNAPWNDTLTIPIQASSTTASTIELSNVRLTIDRTVPEGEVRLSVGGSAVDMVNLGVPFAAAVQVANAKCVTPAPGEVSKVATFTIGSTTYKIGETEYTIDVAPFIENGRTYLPVRFVANAVGVADANIMWDDSTWTATLIKGDRVVQLKINSKVMKLNGVEIAMDVPAKWVSGRTVLPIRWVAQALGCTVDWDEATQTVTVTQ